MSERLCCYSREDLINSRFFDTVQRELCHYLGHNLFPMIDESWPKERAREKAEEVRKHQYLSGCEENFVYARVTVEGLKKNQEITIERGLKKIVERWITRYGDHIRKKHGFMPYILVSPVESFGSSDPEETAMTICMVAYIQ